MSGQLIGATQVLGGGGQLVATSQQGNLEYGQIDLVFGPGGGAAVGVGGNYTLRSGAGSWKSVCTSREGDMLHFKVM
jgi:hypothetical protein